MRSKEANAILRDGMDRREGGLTGARAPLLPVDHVVLLAPNLDASAARLKAAGFLVTPYSQHSQEMGTANRCVMLGSTYIELLAVERPTPRSVGWQALLEAGGGLRGLALRACSVERVSQSLVNAGYEASEIIAFSRLEGDGELRFRICRLPASATPGFRLLVCEHQTPELLWQPQWLRHPNGAVDLIGVISDIPTVDALLGRVGEGLAEAEALPTIPVATGASATKLVIATTGEAGEIDLRPELGITIELRSAV